jgi:multidrug transporter EmrE-like cation transporter
MNVTFVVGIFFGMLGGLFLNVGKGVQKQKVHVLLKGKAMFGREHRRDLLIWITGTLMVTAAVPTFSLSLKFAQSPSIVSSMTGIGLIGLVIYALYMLREKLSKTDSIGIVLVIIGTTIVGYLGSEKEISARIFSVPLLVKTLGIFVVVFAAACITSFYFIKRIYGVIFGLTAGAFIGIAMFLGDTALIKSGGSFGGQLLNPYPYFAILFATVAMIVTQIAFFRSRALEVVPSVNSAVIIQPLLLEFIIYHSLPTMLSLSFIAVIVMGVVLLSVGTASKIS